MVSANFSPSIWVKDQPPYKPIIVRYFNRYHILNSYWINVQQYVTSQNQNLRKMFRRKPLRIIFGLPIMELTNHALVKSLLLDYN